MIKSVQVTNHLGQSIKIVLTEGEPDHGLIITSIDGLGPAKATINTTDISMFDGALYNSARLQTRNIVFSFLFVGCPTIEDARQLTYKYFPIKRNVELVIETDNRLLSTIGYVESNEPEIFSQQEGCNISLLCPDPYLYSAEGLRTSWFSGVDHLFEFVFSNESLSQRLLVMGEISERSEKTVYYEGDLPIGIVITIQATEPAGSITIYNSRTRERMHIDANRIQQITGSPIQAMDEIIINTNRGQKNVQLLRKGHYTNILNALDKDSDWFTLEKGANQFTYVATAGAVSLQFKIENQVAYEGA